jgi:hypothetical protein
MQGVTRLISGMKLFGAVVALVYGFSASPNLANAQGSQNSQGQNAACSSSSGCSTTAGSSAFIDASMFAASAPNICGILHAILIGTLYPAAGAVIDARGLPGTTGTSMTCTASPWAGINNPPPATILLPAGTIVISHPGWTLPANTRLIGVGNDDVAGSNGTVVSGTIIQACKTGQTGCTAFTSTDTAITMCSSGCGTVFMVVK